MARSVCVSVIQMDGSPAPVAERLAHAELRLIEAVAQGADLVVFPECFNTGVTYLETNYEVTEYVDGETFQWCIEHARHHGIHIAGAWMIADAEDTYLSAFLVAPDGQFWRYDKQYPFLWERVFYREGRGILVAKTALGRIGIMVGWDSAHADVWERYAARVDLLLVLSAEYDLTQAILQFPDDIVHRLTDLGIGIESLARLSGVTMQATQHEQIAWMQIPTVFAGMQGTFQTILPAPFFSVGALVLLRQDLWEIADQYHADAQLVAPFTAVSRIVDATGTVIAQADIGSILTTSVMLADQLVIPETVQPTMVLPMWVSPTIDAIAPALFMMNYRRGVRRQWGARMGRTETFTRIWVATVAITSLFASLLTQWLMPRKKIVKVVKKVVKADASPTP